MKDFLVRISSMLLKLVIRFSPPKSIGLVKNEFLEKIDKLDDSFSVIKSYPKKSKSISSKIDTIKTTEKVAIVIQGPIVEEENFTLETVRLYKKLFPEHIIVVSTWKNTNEAIVNELKKLDITLLLNDLPKSNGSFNINYQIYSSREGIIESKKLGASFVYKTRSDQRMYNSNITPFMISKLKSIPTQEKQLNYRLISCSMTSLKYRPYGLGDMLMFGQIDDMLLYWDCGFDQRNYSKNTVRKDYSVKEWGDMNFAESYLCTNFLKKLNLSTPINLNRSLNIYRELFYILDYSKLELFWFKYDWRNDSRFNYTRSHTHELLSNLDWNLLDQMEFLDEKILDSSEGAYIE